MKQEIDYDKLIVNPENYRFDPVDNQEEAIDLMLDEKGPEIFNLAKHILENGLDQANDLRVSETKKKFFLVLDGNRRVTAVKCLHDPNIIKNENLKKRFLRILKTGTKPPGKINCFMYKDEKSAAQWVKLDHTGKNEGVGQDPWGAQAVDRFDYKFSGKISPAMQAVDLLQVKTKEVIDKKALKISTVNRILSNPESRAYLGVNIEKGQLILIADEAEVLSRLQKLFGKIIADDMTVAKVYQTSDSIRFMQDTFGNKPQPPSNSGSTKPKKPTTSTTKSLPKSTSRKYLIPKDCNMVINERKINNIYRELRDDLLLDSSAKSVPNAAGVLFRVFLEVTLDCYIENFQLPVKPDAKLSGKITNVADALERQKIAIASQLANIRQVATAKQSLLSISNFHAYVHSFKTQPSPDDLKIKWDNLQEFFEIIWAEIDKKLSAKRLK